MQIDLPSDAAHFIEGLVASGEYQSADEAIADGVRLLMGRQQLRTEIQKGIDELDAVIADGNDVVVQHDLVRDAPGIHEGAVRAVQVH